MPAAAHARELRYESMEPSPNGSNLSLNNINMANNGNQPLVNEDDAPLDERPVVNNPPPENREELQNELARLQALLANSRQEVEEIRNERDLQVAMVESLRQERAAPPQTDEPNSVPSQPSSSQASPGGGRNSIGAFRPSVNSTRHPALQEQGVARTVGFAADPVPFEPTRPPPGVINSTQSNMPNTIQGWLRALISFLDSQPGNAIPSAQAGVSIWDIEADTTVAPATQITARPTEVGSSNRDDPSGYEDDGNLGCHSRVEFNKYWSFRPGATEEDIRSRAPELISHRARPAPQLPQITASAAPSASRAEPSTQGADCQDRSSDTRFQRSISDSAAPLGRANGGPQSRLLDPIKIRKYIGRRDYRNPKAFVREFELHTDMYNRDDITRGRAFIACFDPIKYRAAGHYPLLKGYRWMRNYFLATEWSPAIRNSLRHEVEIAQYDESEFESEADFFDAMYQKLYDCEITVGEIHGILHPKMPIHFQTQIRVRDFASLADFNAALRQIQGGSVGLPAVRPLPRKRNLPPGTAAVMSMESEVPDSGYADLEADDSQSSGNED